MSLISLINHTSSRNNVAVIRDDLGVIYNALKTLDLSEGTRDYLERAEFAFGPDPMLISATRLIRNSVYGPTGRILFNAIFSPTETADEFRTFTIKEHVDRALSDSFLR